MKKSMMIKINVVIAFLVIAICLHSFIFYSFSQAEEINNTAIINLNDTGVFQNNFIKVLSGKQDQAINFGKNFALNTNGNTKNEGSLRWRVLSTNDTKYGKEDSILLWADYSIGKAKYNSYFDNPNFAFWNRSYISALLNGGKCLDTVNSSSDNVTCNTTLNGWVNTIFNDNEKLAIVDSKEYETVNFGYSSSSSFAPYFITNNLVGDEQGQYSNTLLTNANISATGTSVIEKTTNNQLFLLDYYDINNIDYGFDENGITYASKVNANWKPDVESGYPAYFDNEGIIHNKFAFDYLKDNSTSYWLRPAGRRNATESVALTVEDAGYVFYASVDTEKGVRPAFNLNANNIIFASSSNVAINDTLQDVTTTNANIPTYDVYIKSNDFVNYNSNDVKPQLTASKNHIVVNTALTGKAVVLLTEKNNTGAVKYQAVADIVDGKAIVNVPVNISNDYNVAVLFTDSITNDGAKVVKGSFITSYPTYTINEYDVTFNNEDGSTVSTIVVDKNGVIPSDKVPTTSKENTPQYTYTFDGWYNGDTKWNFETDKVNDNIVLTAKFTQTINKYTVTFDGKNETSMEYGSLITKPSDPTKAETEQYTYIFDGWYNGDAKWNFETDKVTDNVNLVAKFTETIKKFTVTFDNENGVEVEYGAVVKAPSNPTKPSDKQYTYIFDGWYNGDTKWDFNTNKVTNDINLVAKFNSVINSYKVVVEFVGLEKGIKISHKNYGENIDFAEFNENGYTFKVSVNNQEVSSIQVDGNITILVTYTQVKKGCGSDINGSLLSIVLLVGFSIVCLLKNKGGQF